MSKCGSFKGNKMFIRTLYPLKNQYMQDLNRNESLNMANGQVSLGYRSAQSSCGSNGLRVREIREK